MSGRRTISSIKIVHAAEGEGYGIEATLSDGMPVTWPLLPGFEMPPSLPYPNAPRDTLFVVRRTIVYSEEHGGWAVKQEADGHEPFVCPLPDAERASFTLRVDAALSAIEAGLFVEHARREGA